MSFVGELEHLPIVDVIQLLNSTRKSGTLCIKSKKGESQLVFIDGFIVSANHVNTSVRIGQILLEMKAITREDLESALAEQFNAGTSKAPLIASLIEKGKIAKEVAYRGLETLIEMTIVEVLTWKSGTFELDVDKILISDEYRYFPEKLKQDIMLNPQSILMDALRIYDEKMRDGTLTDETFATEDFVDAGFDADWEAHEDSPAIAATEAITADLLGLDDLESLEKRIPDVFSGVRELPDPAAAHRKSLRSAMSAIPDEQQGLLLDFLTSLGKEVRTTPPGAPTLSIILYSNDDLIKHTVTTLFKHDGHVVFTTDDADTLDKMIDKALSRDLVPVLLFEPPAKTDGSFSRQQIITLLQEKRPAYPYLPIVQMTGEEDAGFSLQALLQGATLIIPWPGRNRDKIGIAEEIIQFLHSLKRCLDQPFTTPDRSFAVPARTDLNLLRECIFELDNLSDAQDVSLVILKFAVTIFERALTFVVGKADLIAEKSIGIRGDKSEGASAPLMFRVPLSEHSLLRKTVETGQLYIGDPTDDNLSRLIYQEIPPPGSPTITLVPIKSMGRVIALVYGDFGAKPGATVETDQLQILAHHAGLVLENTFYRKKFAPSG
jgi:hypothetical protein